MKKRLISVLLLVVLVLTMLAACGSDVIAAEEARDIALEAMGLELDDVDDAHVHVVTYQNQSCYGIHITVDGTEHEYIISGKTGEILSPAAK